jgi:hypothetical protein
MRKGRGVSWQDAELLIAMRRTERKTYQLVKAGGLGWAVVATGHPTSYWDYRADAEARVAELNAKEAAK